MNERDKRSEVNECLYVSKVPFTYPLIRYLSPYPCFVPGTVILCEDYGHSLLFNIDSIRINFFNLKTYSLSIWEHTDTSHVGCLFCGISFRVWSGLMSRVFSWRLLPSFQRDWGSPRALSPVPIARTVAGFAEIDYECLQLLGKAEVQSVHIHVRIE